MSATSWLAQISEWFRAWFASSFDPSSRLSQMDPCGIDSDRLLRRYFGGLRLHSKRSAEFGFLAAERNPACSLSVGAATFMVDASRFNASGSYGRSIASRGTHVDSDRLVFNKFE